MNVVESVEHEQGVGLVNLAPELMHKVALSGWLTFNDVTALSKTCRRMKNIFVDDDYGRDIHYALKGVMENVRRKRWRSARFAVRRKWFVEGEEEEDEGSVWREVARVVASKKMVLDNEEDLAGWENVVLAALSLPGASGWEEMWTMYSTAKTFLVNVAAEVGSEKVIDWVLERGGDLEGRDSLGATPLWYACRGGCLRMVRKLVEERGADVMTKDRNSVSVLTAASWKGHADVTAYLLGLGVLDVAAEGCGRSSSLCTACRGNHTEVIKLLVEAGADVDVEGMELYGSLFIACQNGNAEIVRLLVEAGSGSGAAKDGGVWVRGLAEAAVAGHVDVVRVLLDAGVVVGGVNQVGDTVLDRAVLNGSVDVVRMLVREGGADVNRVGRMGWTPLIRASWEGREDVVRVLLELGADAGVRDGGGETALDVARRRGKDGVVGVLEAWG